MNNTIFSDFSKWLDLILEENNFNGVVAFNFNLYEGIDDEGIDGYHIQLIGSDKFDIDDSDWACPDEIFTTGENIFVIASKHTEEEWYEVLDFCIKMIIEYLENGIHKDKLLEKTAIGVGFVDGDLYIVYNNGVVEKNIKIE
ncbi:MAG: hypothetical protein LBO68_05290, partial [Synergistaceae bacterium]|nr:hypothetical protein [Synergistaceae bacterium]